MEWNTKDLQNYFRDLASDGADGFFRFYNGIVLALVLLDTTVFPCGSRPTL
jgi:hypothetical protein